MTWQKESNRKKLPSLECEEAQARVRDLAPASDA